MADPVFVPCPANAWTLVAETTTSGILRKDSTKPAKYLQTYVTAGGTAPTLETEGVPVFQGSFSAAIAADALIDVYIWAAQAAGRVRVDLA